MTPGDFTGDLDLYLFPGEDLCLLRGELVPGPLVVAGFGGDRLLVWPTGISYSFWSMIGDKLLFGSSFRRGL